MFSVLSEDSRVQAGTIGRQNAVQAANGYRGAVSLENRVSARPECRSRNARSSRENAARLVSVGRAHVAPVRAAVRQVEPSPCPGPGRQSSSLFAGNV